MPTAAHQRNGEEGECLDFPAPFLFMIARIRRRIDLVVMAWLNVQNMKAAVGSRR